MNKNSVVCIPSRYGSTRFPGKPLALISGRSLIERVWRIAAAAVGNDKAFVLTDDERILNHALDFGGQALMTPPECKNGTERVHAALELLPKDTEILINLQGDAVLTPPWVIEAVINAIAEDKSIGFATPAVRLSLDRYNKALESLKNNSIPGGTFVSFDKEHRALYFSRSIIPFLRHVPNGEIPVFKHIGLYGYRPEVLRRYVNLQESTLEKAEGLEQLRALENGLPIKVVEVDYRGRTQWSVDSPGDIKKVEDILSREGELF